MEDDVPLLAKLMAPCLENGTIYNNLTRWTKAVCGNATNSSWDMQHQQSRQLEGSGGGDGDIRVEHVVSVVVGICFGLIGLVGLLGNSLVILGKCVMRTK